MDLSSGDPGFLLPILHDKDFGIESMVRDIQGIDTEGKQVPVVIASHMKTGNEQIIGDLVEDSREDRIHPQRIIFGDRGIIPGTALPLPVEQEHVVREAVAFDKMQIRLPQAEIRQGNPTSQQFPETDARPCFPDPKQRIATLRSEADTPDFHRTKTPKRRMIQMKFCMVGIIETTAKLVQAVPKNLVPQQESKEQQGGDNQQEYRDFAGDSCPGEGKKRSAWRLTQCSENLPGRLNLFHLPVPAIKFILMYDMFANARLFSVSNAVPRRIGIYSQTQSVPV